jgi:rubrerythrin
MSESFDQRTTPGALHEHDAPDEESSCLQWRCRGCGAVCLGTLADKPARCPGCGAAEFEFASED